MTSKPKAELKPTGSPVVCISCGGETIKSRNDIGFFKADGLGKPRRMYHWACTSCGHVAIYMEEATNS